MPADTIRKQPPKGKGKGKIAGLDWKIWAGGFVLAVAVGLYLRHHSAASAAASPTTAAAPADAGGIGGASGSGTDPNAAAPGIDTTGLEDAINNLGYVLGGGGGLFTTQPFDTTGFATATAPTFPSGSAQPYINSSQPGTIYSDASGATFAQQPSGEFQPAYVGPAGSYVSPLTYLGAGASAGSISASQVAAPRQVTPPATVNPGGVASSVPLRNGATLTTLSSGRKIEKAPGKSPYVVHK